MRDPTEPTNESRADFAEKTLWFYANLKDAGQFPDESTLSDLLADLMHLARRVDADFESAISTARVNFNAEVQEESDENSE